MSDMEIRAADPDKPVYTGPTALRDLKPGDAKFILSIGRFIEKDLGLDIAGKRLVVGCSGGVDSSCLLFILSVLAKPMRLWLQVAHLDHQLRPDSADDALFTSELAHALGLKCVMRQADVAGFAERAKIGVEEAGREVRKRFFAERAKDFNADCVAVGHNLNDLAEDTLMRLLRGTGRPCVAAMPGFDEARKLLRPLLLTPRKNLEALALSVGLPFRIDPSNADRRFLRNRIRLDVLPKLAAENPRFLEGVALSWRVERGEEAFWVGEIDKILAHAAGMEDDCAAEVFLPRKILESVHSALRLRVFKRVLDELGPGQALAGNIMALETAFAVSKEAVFQFPGRKTASTGRLGVLFRSGADCKAPKAPL